RSRELIGIAPRVPDAVDRRIDDSLHRDLHDVLRSGVISRVGRTNRAGIDMYRWTCRGGRDYYRVTVRPPCRAAADGGAGPASHPQRSDVPVDRRNPTGRVVRPGAYPGRGGRPGRGARAGERAEE